MPLQHFHPTVRQWFQQELGQATAPQQQGWPKIRKGENVLIAAPTGTGKTLAAFLCAIDQLLQKGEQLSDGTQVLYISPLKALANDVQKNLHTPLQQMRELDANLPEIRVMVRSGDTQQSERSKMLRKPPHILVTTPESLYILLTSDGGRRMLQTVRTVIVDEVHAILGSKRGSHLALSLERLSALCTSSGGEPQRIGLSATQKPIADVANFLTGCQRSCALVDAGHLRHLDLDICLPSAPLSAVCSHEVWEEIYQRMVALIQEHRTTLIFTNTRKLTERIAARLTQELGCEQVTSHHGSLSQARRLDAEQRLKNGELRALVATSSLELGIDIGDVDLVIQVGVTPSIATFLQRVGRAGHGVGRIPKGRMFPLTLDELLAGAAILQAVRQGQLDRTPQPGQPLDILAQQIIAACVAETWDTTELFACFSRAWPYRHLSRQEFDSLLTLHSQGRRAMLHVDQIQGRVRATRGARLPAITGGGAIPDQADYKVVVEADQSRVGSVHEDFAIESSGGDIFQLGNHSWRVLWVSRGTMHVADAGNTPPSLPFWLGEAPSRSRELCEALSEVRQQGPDPEQLKQDAQQQINQYLQESKVALGDLPSTSCIIAERFFDETGGMQLIIHMPFGSRINRAFGLALRKRFCRSFGFELQAAANEEAVVLSLGPMHSFALEEVFGYLKPQTVRHVLIQAMLPVPMFQARWRWNVSRSLLVPRSQGGKRVPAALLRMRADDALATAFPQALACGETLPPGDLPVPMHHPLVRQTVEDCLHEAMDIEGLEEVLQAMQKGSIRTLAVDRNTPSPMAQGILAAGVYSFLDDAPLEERRTQAVLANRRGQSSASCDDLSELDPKAVQRVQEEAWPQPRDAEEVHETLLWMGYVTQEEADGWQEGAGGLTWLQELQAQGRVQQEEQRYYATESSRDAKQMLHGRMEALGPVFVDKENIDPLLLSLENDGHLLRCRIQGRDAFCERRLLARIRRYTLDSLRQEIQPVSLEEYLHFLTDWQHLHADQQLEGQQGVLQVCQQLAGFEIPAAAWEAHVLPARVKDYRQSHLDQLMLQGELTWLRLWGQGQSPMRSTPITVLPRQQLAQWLALAGAHKEAQLSGPADSIKQLLEQQGAMFLQELQDQAGLLPSYLEQGLSELMAAGLLTCDSFLGLRQFLAPPSRRRLPVQAMGRYSLIRRQGREVVPEDAEFLAMQYLQRYGVVFRRALKREKMPLPWYQLLKVYRLMELRGEVRGGRFVMGSDGEQFALPRAIPFLRKNRQQERPALQVSAADPLNLQGILNSEDRISPLHKTWVQIGG